MNDERTNSTIDAAWLRAYENMCEQDGCNPVDCLNSMLTVASKLAERTHGPREAAAQLVRASLYFVERAKAAEASPTSH
jgi:hypothetical protein